MNQGQSLQMALAELVNSKWVALLLMGRPQDSALRLDNEPSAVDLSSMTKAEIVDHAKDVHGLDLDPKTNKDDLIAAVEAHVEQQSTA